MTDVRSLVSVEQTPVIRETLALVKQDWLTKADEAATLVATPDTLQSVKERRAQIRKEFSELDDIRKGVKDAIMKPYLDFEAVFKDSVTNTFNDIDARYKAQIDSVQNALKTNCENACRELFSETCAALGVKIMPFEALHLKIGMVEANAKTQPPKKLCEAIQTGVEAVARDLHAIDAMEDAGEILTEYEQCFNLAHAVNTVRTRKEAAARHAEEARRRAEAAKAEAERLAAMKTQLQAEPTVTAPAVAPAEPVQPAPAPAPDPNEILTVTFKATGPRYKLIALREWMKKEGIQYE